MKRETKDKFIMVSLEQTIHEAATNYATRLEISHSAYVRNLIVADLVERGLLTQEDLLRITGL